MDRALGAEVITKVKGRCRSWKRSALPLSLVAVPCPRASARMSC